jgi:beta-phosphoglucomutase
VSYASKKQARLEELVRAGNVMAFPDALRLVEATLAMGWRLAVASSSTNATRMMGSIRLPSGRGLLDAFAVNVCGRKLQRGKPDPELFLIASAELEIAPAYCLVAEDAPAGIAAAKAGGMAALGIARLGDAALLRAAGADVVVTNLDDVALDALARGRLSVRGHDE